MCMRRGAEATAAPGGSTDSVGVLSHADTTDTTEQIQLQIDEQVTYSPHSNIYFYNIGTSV